METSAEICGKSIPQSLSAREDRSSRRQPERLHSCLRDGNLQLHPLAQSEGIGLQLLNVCLSMDAQNIFVGCRLRHKKIALIGKPFLQQRIVNHLEFL